MIGISSIHFSMRTMRCQMRFINLNPQISNLNPQSSNLKSEITTLPAFTIALANASQYGNNAYIAPYASMADGLMDVTIIEPFPMTEAPAMAYRLFSGKFEDGTKHIRMFQTSRLKIVRERAGVIHCDGDPMKAPREIEVSIVPGGLRVICESDADARTQPLYQTLGQQMASLTQPAAEPFRQASQMIVDVLKKIEKPSFTPHKKSEK